MFVTSLKVIFCSISPLFPVWRVRESQLVVSAQKTTLRGLRTLWNDRKLASESQGFTQEGAPAAHGGGGIPEGHIF